MNTNHDKEADRSEDRVASFRQALRRMHEDPAEAARIDSMIDDAETVAQPASELRPPQGVVVNVNGGEHNTIEISSAQHDPNAVLQTVTLGDLRIADIPRQRRSARRPAVTNLVLTATVGLALLAIAGVCVVYAGQGLGLGVALPMFVLYGLTAAVAVRLAWMWSRTGRPAPKGLKRAAQSRQPDRDRELHP